MSKPEMRFENARELEQLERMKKLQEEGKCFFCKDNYLLVDAPPPLFSNRHWAVRKSDFPYPGTLHHYLIVSRVHVKKISELSLEAGYYLIKAVRDLEKRLGTPGEALFARSGDLKYTGATIDHLHFHFISAEVESEETEPIRVKLGFKKKQPSK